MKKIVMLLCMLIPYIVSAQRQIGVPFETRLSWIEVLAKAKAENKMIFIDAMATWCGPCKKMDKEVYTDKELGAFMDSNFISVQVQLDSTSHDKEYTKMWYENAKAIQQTYHITAMPSLIYLDSNGKLNYMDVGYKNLASFKETSKLALSSTFAKTWQSYLEGKADSADLLNLSLHSKKYGQDSLALSLAKKYKHNFFDTHAYVKNLKFEHAEFFMNFIDIFSINDKAIKYLYSHSETADKLFRKEGFSQTITDYLITKKFISPLLLSDKFTPKWGNLERQISKYFDSKTAYRVLLNAKISWYEQKKDYNNYIHYYMEKLELKGVNPEGMEAFFLNNFIYEVVLKYSSDIGILSKCAKYMESIVANDPYNYSSIDTYSCILYKAGEKSSAIVLEEKALQLAKTENDKQSVTEFEEKIYKMRNNQPLWAVSGLPK
jgi:thioredoxin-related protein